MASKVFPDYIVQEIRSLIAVLCRNQTMTGKSADGETVVGQELLMEKMFHGSEGYASHVDLFSVVRVYLKWPLFTRTLRTTERVMKPALME
jgi:hypothetical protein